MQELQPDAKSKAPFAVCIAACATIQDRWPSPIASSLCEIDRKK